MLQLCKQEDHIYRCDYLPNNKFVYDVACLQWNNIIRVSYYFITF